MKTYNLIVFAPVDATDKILKAIGDAGAGVIGDYTHCANISSSQGRFLPGKDADPEIGQRGEITTVKENRIESTCTEDKVRAVVRALKQAHPYEEVPYYLFERIVF